MKKGRITTKEKERRLAIVLEFIFTFRYVLSSEIKVFIKEFLGENIKGRWFIEDAVMKGLIGVYDIKNRGYFNHKKFYYLTKEGLNCLNPELPLHKYSFRPERINITRMIHDRYVIKTYFILMKKYKGSRWVGEWMLYLNQKRFARIPDGVFVLKNGITIAIEVERSLKKMTQYKKMMVTLRKHVVRDKDFDSILIVALDDQIYRKVLNRVLSLKAGFSDTYVYLTNLDLLKKNYVIKDGRQVSLNQMLIELEDQLNEMAV